MELYKAQGTANAEYLMMKDSEAIAEGAFYFSGVTGAEEVDAVANDVRALTVGFLDNKGAPLGSGHSVDLDGTFVQNNSGNIYTAAADNSTDKKIKVHGHIVEDGDIFTALLDANVGTTTGSGIPGYFISVLTTDATMLDESTATGTQSGNTAFMLVDNGKGENSAVHPTRGGNWVLFKVVEVQE